MSNELITKETVDTILKGGESITKVAAGVATELTDEAIKLFIFTSVMSILKVAVVFVVFHIINKYLDTMLKAEEQSGSKDTGKFKALKTTALVASLIFFTAASFPHMVEIGKALVAPKIFLAEKAVGLRK